MNYSKNMQNGDKIKVFADGNTRHTCVGVSEWVNASIGVNGCVVFEFVDDQVINAPQEKRLVVHKSDLEALGFKLEII